ncbi:MAG: N-acetyl-gamma-glutamyl-phosphate reductase [Sumerlaeia bacterium]
MTASLESEQTDTAAASTNDKVTAAILGATGYGGGELLRLLGAHPRVEVAYATSRSKAGVPVGQVHRGMLGRSDLQFSDPAPDAIIDACDVVFGAMPHAASAQALAPFVDAGVPVVDLSGDFRLRDVATYEKWYKHTHPRPDLLSKAVYGCPELNREALRGAKLIACAGCFATAINLALLPAAAARAIAGPASIVAMTGSSGSGTEAKPGTHHPTRAMTLRPYKVLDHQHTPEVLQLLADAGKAPDFLEFTPISAPIVRGILVVATAPVAEGFDAPAAYADFYADAPFVQVLDGGEPEPGPIAGTNFTEVRARVKNGRLHVTCAIDNLVKGASGQAIQCFNLAMGWPEDLGLGAVGAWP